MFLGLRWCTDEIDDKLCLVPGHSGHGTAETIPSSFWHWHKPAEFLETLPPETLHCAWDVDAVAGQTMRFSYVDDYATCEPQS